MSRRSRGAKTTTRTTTVSRREPAQGRRARGRQRARSSASRPIVSAQPVTLRYLGTAVNQANEIAKKVKADLGHRHRVRAGHHRRREPSASSRSPPPSTSSTPSTSSSEKLVPSGNLSAWTPAQDQERRQDHAGLHQGRGGRQDDRRPGHRAQEGVLPRRQELDEVLGDADAVDHLDPTDLQRRHARHPPRPDQAADRALEGAAQPRVQGQGLDPQHPVDRHHGRRHGGRVHGRVQVPATRAT